MRALTHFRRLVREESGQALVLAGLGMTVVVAFLAIAIDVGQLRYEQTKLQSAADAAAIAGALEISTCGSTYACTTMQTAVKQALTENGFSGSVAYTNCGTPGSGLTVAVNQGPCQLGSTSSDPNYGNSNYVEVVVSYPQPTYFARVIGVSSVKISVRAEAGLGNSPDCLYLSTNNTSTSANQALLVNGSATISASCGIVDDAGGTQAAVFNGGDTIDSTGLYIHGGDLNNGSNTLSPSPTTGVTAVSDPLSYLTPPTAGSCTYTNEVVNSGSGTVALGPGTYCGGLTINGSATVTFSSGTYIMQGNMIVNGGDTISGSDLTFYFSSGSLTMNGSSSADLVAPTTGSYAGILIYQNSSDSSGIILNGESNSVWQGAIYAPDANLTINGGGNLAAYTIVDTESMTVNGGVDFTLGANYSSLPGGSPAKSSVATLME
jgi:Flp pilus assembly protein TadG